MRTVSIGAQGFDTLREKNCFYIDKTDFIKEWWESNDVVTLLTRPRRFGKTLNLNMVECFFSTRYENRSDLFEGLSIWKEEGYQELQGTYPVISMSFGSIKGKDFKDARDAIVDAVYKAYEEHSYLKNSDLLSEEERRDYDFFKNYSNNGQSDRVIEEQTVKNSIYRLGEYLHRYYNKKVIILLDEYDTPMQEAYVSGYWNEIVTFIRGMFNVTFKENPYLERAIMTGITRVSKESVFSDLNHLNVVTTTSNQYETSFGFTENEVFAALDEMGLSDQKDEIKAWYDGFTFGKKMDIYNPWSITNFLKFKEYRSYWADTSSNSLISYLIRTGSSELKETMELLLDGKYLAARIDEQMVFSNLDENEDAVWSLLLASGYLKVRKREFNVEDGEFDYELLITNREVLIMFRKMIKGWFGKTSGNYNKFTRSLLRGNVEEMNYYMESVTDYTISSFDSGIKASEKEQPERFYHGLVLGLIVELRDRYQVKSNRESGLGRYDVMLIPRKGNDENYPAIVIEFKVFDGKREKTLEDTVRRALDQINEKKYDMELIDQGIPESQIRHYGIAFKGKEVLINTNM